MIFPIAIKYKKALRGMLTPEQQSVALQYIQTRITERKADRVIITETSVSYKGSTSGSRGSIFKTVDGGTFSLIDNNDRTYMVYEYSMRELFIWTSIIAVVFGTLGVIGQIWWSGPVIFLWIGGMNWLIAVMRHGDLALQIARGIDDLLWGKLQKEENENDPDKEKLKSWF